MKNVLLYGLSTYKNRGCEAIVLSTINQINNYNPKLKIVEACFDYDYNKNYYNEKISYVKHYLNEKEFNKEQIKKNDFYKKIMFNYNNFELLNQSNVVDEVINSDLCISVGGDNYCYQYNHWLYSINNIAKQYGKKTILWGASLFEEINDPELISDLKKYDVLYIRESLSYNAVIKHVDKRKVLLIPDPAFALKPQKINVNKWYKNREIIGLNLSPLTIKNQDDMMTIKKFVEYILNNTKYSICLFSHVTTEDCSDNTVLKEIYKYFDNNDRVYFEENDYNCEQIKYLISNFKYLIASRTHASIAAYSLNIPTLVIGYSVKSKGIAKDIFNNIDNYVIPYENLTIENLIDHYNYIDKNYDSIKTHLSKFMPNYIKKSSSAFEECLKTINKTDNFSICPKDTCTGCLACKCVCPVDAISIKQNEDGFSYPCIDENKCIKCNKCKSICPINSNNNSIIKEINCFAVKAKDKHIQLSSSSGGVFYYLAKAIIDENGIVYGAGVINNHVKHIRINNSKDLVKIMGSKYSQSNTDNIYKSVLTDLNSDKFVLFSGTPCQINGLRCFLHKDYEKLICVSVICHGVMSNDLLQKFLKEKNCFNFNFRNKTLGWENLTVKYNTKKEIKEEKYSDNELMSLYCSDYTFRDSCYNCRNKKNIMADIIIGDYWGIWNYHSDFFDDKGVSSVIIKTTKGYTLFNKIINSVDYKETNYENILNGNPYLECSVNKPIERFEIFSYIKKNSIHIVNSYLKNKKVAQEYDVLLNKYQNLVNENNHDKMKVQICELQKRNEEIQKELYEITNSKRWKLINRIANITKKVKK